MARFKKRMLASPEYHSPDGQVDVTPERLKHWADQFQAFTKSKLKVPVAFGHAENPRGSHPYRMTRGSRPPEGTVGHMVGFEVLPDGQGAEIEIDVPGEQDAQKCRDNLVGISPTIFQRWPDGKKRVWEDVITHADLVIHPVDHEQSDFEEVGAVACSLCLVPEEGEATVYRFQAEGTPAESGDSGNEGEPPAPADVSVGNEGDRLKKVLDALRTHKIVLSDDTNEENFLEHLEQALLTVAAIAGEGDMSDQNQTPPQQQPMTPEPPQMSAMALDHKRLEAYSSKAHREKVSSRLHRLLETGRCTPPEFEDRKELPKAINLSLDDDGNHKPTDVEAWIAAREEIPAGTFWTDEQRTRMSKMTPESPPSFVTGIETVEDAEKVADEVFGRRKATAK